MISVAAAYSVVPSRARRVAGLTTQRASRMESESKSERPKWIDLPRQRVDDTQLSGVEIAVGRLAMVGFFGLLAGEVIADDSFLVQISKAIESMN
jgi:hypothetical protein